MSFKTVLLASRGVAIDGLLRRAALSNRLAKSALNASGRRACYAQKSLAISRLISLGAGHVEEESLVQGLVTVRLSNGRRQHVPIDQLPPEALNGVKSLVGQGSMSAPCN